jgi:uridine kinase
VRTIIAIDGCSAAGKSSLAARLKETHSCNVIPMDGFFLRPCQRSPARLAEPGGNIDYERFCLEVAEPLKRGEAFSYRPYNCQTGELSDPVAVPQNPLTVVEGVYSLHPRFEGLYDLTIFLSVGEAEQCSRLLARDAGLYDRFIHEWIPMENKYFEHFQIPGKCDYYIKGDEYDFGKKQ